MISRRGAKAQRNDTLSVSAPLREEETFLDNYTAQAEVPCRLDDNGHINN